MCCVSGCEALMSDVLELRVVCAGAESGVCCVSGCEALMSDVLELSVVCAVFQAA